MGLVGAPSGAIRRAAARIGVVEGARRAAGWAIRDRTIRIGAMVGLIRAARPVVALEFDVPRSCAPCGSTRSPIAVSSTAAGRTSIVAAARERGVPVRVVRAGMHWQTDDDVVLDVLAPSTPFLADTGDDVNENSIVVLLSYRLPGGRTYRALFTGDAGEGSERRLLAHDVNVRADLWL